MTHKQNHYNPVLQLFALVGFLVIAVSLQEELSPLAVTVVVLVYFVGNIVHSVKSHTLDVGKVVELGLLSLICEFLILNYII